MIFRNFFRKSIARQASLYQSRRFFLTRKPNSFSNFSFLKVNYRLFCTTKVQEDVNKEKINSDTTSNKSEAEPIETKANTEPINVNEEFVGETKSYDFKAETRKLLDIVSHSIYTDKEVFLRELISNASDAIEQVRFTVLTNPENLIKSDKNFEIRIYTDPEKNTITIQDFGIGMTEKQLKENLGTIARSGSKNFLNRLKSDKNADEAGDSKGLDIIGQFGVGFYSSFMVSRNVEVQTQSALISDNKKSNAFYQKSDGTGSYEIGAAKELPRGSKIVVHLLDNCKEFSDKMTVEKIIKRYSNFLQFPIYLNDKRVNIQGALWLESPNSVSEERYTEFYKNFANAYDTPLEKLHFSTDVPISIQALFFIPESHSEKYGMSRLEPGVSVYSRKVLIKPNSKEILPDQLRFVKGVVDSADLPLHISREDLQDSRLIKRINKFLVKRILNHLSSISKKDPEKFEKFYKEYSLFLKEGVCSDFEHKNSIAKLIRFDSSGAREKKLRSFDDYISDMKTGQKNIYYLLSSSRQVAESSPYYEAFKRNNTEVLFLYSEIDEFLVQTLATYNHRKFVSIEAKDINIDDIKNVDLEKQHKHKLSDKEGEELCEQIEKIMPKSIKSAKITSRLEGSPCIIVDHESSSVRSIMKRINPEHDFKLHTQNLEINPSHPVIRGLFYTKNEDEKFAKKVAEQMVDHALISAGLLDDPRKMLGRMEEILSVAMDVEGIEMDIERERKELDKTKLNKDDIPITDVKVKDGNDKKEEAKENIKKDDGNQKEKKDI